MKKLIKTRLAAKLTRVEAPPILRKHAPGCVSMLFWVICCLSASNVEAQQAPDNGPSMQETISFINAGLQQNSCHNYANSDKTFCISQSVSAGESSAPSGYLTVTQNTTSTFCEATYVFRVALNVLDMNSVRTIDNSDGLILQVSTTDLIKLIKRRVSSDPEGCTEGAGSQNWLNLRFEDAQYRQRSIKALKHAIELAGGKPSPF
jgi:hypothetical protein